MCHTLGHLVCKSGFWDKVIEHNLIKVFRCQSVGHFQLNLFENFVILPNSTTEGADQEQHRLDSPPRGRLLRQQGDDQHAAGVRGWAD